MVHAVSVDQPYSKIISLEVAMESNSTQGLAVLAFLVGFTFLGGAFFAGAKLLFIVLFLIGAALSVALFQKAKKATPADDT